MNKGGWAVAVATVAIAGLGSYYAMGYKAESEFKQMITSFNHIIEVTNTTPNTSVLISLDSYHRGLFSSDATIKLTAKMTMPNMRGPGMPSVSHVLPVTISHGPFIFSAGKFGLAYVSSTLSVPEKVSPMFSILFNANSTKPSITFNSLVKFSGNTRVGLTFPPFVLEAKGNQGKLNWKGMNAHWDVYDHMTAVKGQTVFNGFTFSSRQMNGSMGQVSMDYDLNVDSRGLSLGRIAMDFPSLTLGKAGRKLFSLKDFTLSSSTDVDVDLFNMTVAMKLGQLAVMGQKYGPGDVDFEVKRLDADVLAQVKKQFDAMNQPGVSQAVKQQKLQALMPALVKLVAKGAVMDLSRFKLDIPQGTIKASAKATLPEGIKLAAPKVLASQLAMVSNVQVPVTLVKQLLTSTILKKLRHQAYSQQHRQSDSTNTAQETLPIQPAVLQKQAAEQAKVQLDSLIKAKFLTRVGDDYKVTVEVKKGEVLVNGQSFTGSLLN